MLSEADSSDYDAVRDERVRFTKLGVIATVIGIAENLHDSCVTVVTDGRVVLHVELERVLRKKRAVFASAEQVLGLLSWVDRTTGCGAPDAVAVARQAKEPITGTLFKMLTEHYPHAVVESFEHLDCHAGLAVASGRPNIDVIALDAGGDRRIHGGEPNAITRSWDSGQWSDPRFLTAAELPIDGRAWAITSVALFGDIHAAGKTMGLAAYGQPDDEATSAVAELIERSLNWRYDRETLLTLADSLPVADFQAQANVAYALQESFTNAMLRVAATVTGTGRTVVLSGGCALNVTANTRISELLSERSSDVWVPPCPGDEGVSLGAALLMAAQLGDRLQRPVPFPYLGLGQERLPSTAEYRRAAELLATGKVLVTAVGRGEVGPRALGNRSFLALPTTANRLRVSEQMKRREHFRPVAPALRSSDAAEWLVHPVDSPFMSFVSEVTEQMRACCPGAVHFDGTARHQSVDPEIHPPLHALLDNLADLGVPPVLINTSLNIAGNPICLDESDALATALNAGADGILTADGFTQLR